MGSTRAEKYSFMVTGKTNYFRRSQILPIVSIVLCITMQACSKLAFPGPSDSRTISDPSDLNGTYSNQALDTSVANNTLWAVFSRKADEYQFKPDFNQAILTVKLTALSSKKINAQLYQGSALIKELQLKGQLTDSTSFRLKQRNHNRGVPLIYMKLARYGCRLRKDDTGGLLIDVVDSHGKMIFILAGGKTDDYTFRYKLQ